MNSSNSASDIEPVSINLPRMSPAICRCMAASRWNRGTPARIASEVMSLTASDVALGSPGVTTYVSYVVFDHANGTPLRSSAVDGKLKRWVGHFTPSLSASISSPSNRLNTSFERFLFTCSSIAFASPSATAKGRRTRSNLRERRVYALFHPFFQCVFVAR